MQAIGLVGLGAIAQKAYLPFMRQIKDVHWHLFTRNQDVLTEVASCFGHQTIYTSLESLAAANLDGVFIHAATKAHVEIAQIFLKKGIPVYMDKPVAETYDEVLGLYRLAKDHQTFLMTGFNRRFAPKVLTMKEQEKKKRILVEKNDLNRPGDKQFKLFDFFIHPLDTALFLCDDRPKSAYYRYHLDQGQLSQVSVTLETQTATVVASMNLQSGSRREVMEVQTAEATYHLENLDELTIYKSNQVVKDMFGSWETTLYKRGFESIILAFLEAVKTGENPVSPKSSLLSHYLCHQINQATKEQGMLDVKLIDIIKE
ncbi:Gfo/Idh/MocA family protein [Streptococcus sp. sy004]|uniref:Gfo/Idh/MocA family protein n=1 Tax=Streptococcus sp. sy004 TaxID=2600149 RepID=UPI0011B70515|nr:Gfo/Idh/MocA family oxidoreductase [Streptococcus sp. sy004]TWT09830.1 Gfo/Idh/MocA family oxidoreductase [Streptococcus sp. sy004]